MTKMISIQIEEATQKRLKSHAVPLEDSHDTVINRALDALETRKVPIDNDDEMEHNEITINPNRLPDLSHTRILSASVDGIVTERPLWYEMRDRLIRIAMERGKSLNWLREKCITDIITGRAEKGHYIYLRDCGISIPRDSAPRSFQTVVNIALALSIPVRIEVIGRVKASPAFRGKRAMLRIG